MTPLEQIEAMPTNAAPRIAYDQIVAHLATVTGHDATRAAREHVAANLYSVSMVAQAASKGDVLALLAEVTALAALHLVAVQTAEAASAPLVARAATFTREDVLDTHDALTTLDRLPDFGIALDERGN